MSGIIEIKMADCLEQIAELQAKMQHLQEEKDTEEIVNTKEVEPNLKVMSDWLENESLYKNGATFQRTTYLFPNHSHGTIVPTPFMKQYIESTHNMFLIQQKIINKLEQVIEGMYPKLLNEDFEYEEKDSRRL